MVLAEKKETEVLVSAMLEMIHLLEGFEPPEDKAAEELLEVLVVKCARRYDFTSEGDDFFANATARLFDGVIRKWVLKPGWLRCPKDGEEDETDKDKDKDKSKEEEKAETVLNDGGKEKEKKTSSSYARPGLILNVLQLVRLFTRDRHYRNRLAKEKGLLEVLSQFLSWRTKAHFEEKHGTRPFVTPLGREMLVECVSIIRRLATDVDHCHAICLSISQAFLLKQQKQQDEKEKEKDDDPQRLHYNNNIAGTLALLLHTVDYAILPLAIDTLTHIVQTLNKQMEEWEIQDLNATLEDEEQRTLRAFEDILRDVASCGIEIILKMIESYSKPFDKLAAIFLSTLLSLKEVRAKILVDQYKSNQKPGTGPIGGALMVQRLVSKLSYCQTELHVPILNVLTVILQENFLISDLRDVGGIPIILNVLKSDVASEANHKGRGGEGEEEKGNETEQGNRSGKGKATSSRTSDSWERFGTRAQMVMDTICAISQCIQVISIDDEASYQIKQCNGVYLLGRCLVQPWNPMDPSFFSSASASLPATGEGSGGKGPLSLKESVAKVYRYVEPAKVSETRAHVLRAMRYLFSSERNRDIFKTLMPPDFFSSFIDIGHYQEYLKPYLKLAECMYESETKVEEHASGIVGKSDNLAGISSWTRAALKGADKNSQSETLKTVNGYQFIELLGKGAFGSVYKAKKKGLHDEKICAVKELDLDDVHIFGATPAEQEEAKSAIASEMKILSIMDHPGIVHYYESFERDRKVYIAMEYAGGMSLADRIVSLESRNQKPTETEVWQILTQLCLALRYMHQDKQIVHRDLTPANIMISLGHDIVNVDELSSQPLTVRITDFGYAKRKEQAGFVMRSLVGTITFCCPEIVQQQIYTDKADVWSLGCILYNVMLLKPPFKASNIFNIASKIVEGQFDPPIEDDSVPYSTELKSLVARMLTVNPEERPSIGDIIGLISSRIARETDLMRSKIHLLEHEIHMERKYFIREKRIAMKTQNALERANSASSIHSIDTILAQSQPGNHSGDEDNNNVNSGGGGGGTGTGTHLDHSPRPLPVSTAKVTHHQTKGKSSSVSGAKISIPQKNLRVLTDPVLDMLMQVQKLMLVAQLPPSLHHDERRQFLQRVHTRLFAADQRAGAIKSHLAKLMARSPESIDLRGLYPSNEYNTADPSMRVEAAPNLQDISYSHVYEMLEAVLKDTGFFKDPS